MRLAISKYGVRNDLMGERKQARDNQAATNLSPQRSRVLDLYVEVVNQSARRGGELTSGRSENHVASGSHEWRHTQSPLQLENQPAYSGLGHPQISCSCSEASI